MFQLEWQDKNKFAGKDSIPSFRTQLPKNVVSKVLILRWEEHCIECGYPDCYSTCALYQRREDGHCSRFEYGIAANPVLKGHYKFGADISFKRWGKLEANLSNALAGPITPHNNTNWARKFPVLGKRVFGFTQISDLKAFGFDEFVLECYSPNPKELNLFLEYFVLDGGRRNNKLRHSFIVKPGKNYFTIPFASFKMDTLEGYVYLYPEEDVTEKRLVFTWLDFVKYKPYFKDSYIGQNCKHREDKIKCVAWDLDNTLWDGILEESKRVRVRKNVLNVIRQLDEKGILQTIVSRNDYAKAWKEIEEIGIGEYFLYPAINWGQKSENLKAIAQKLNLHPDSFAFIDDSRFERDEVKGTLPGVRVYSEEEIEKLLAYDEFDVTVTEMSRSRRFKYMEESRREEHRAAFADNYDQFLESCNIELEIFIPGEEAEILRCWELVQRTNQLNLSGRRYTRDEFSFVLRQPDIMALGLRCRDKYGDYGIVGFSSIALDPEQPRIVDFVLSCRVAQKKVEYAFFKFLHDLFQHQGYEKIVITLITTQKNEPLRKVFEDLPFYRALASENRTTLHLDLKTGFELREIVKTRSTIFP